MVVVVVLLVCCLNHGYERHLLFEEISGGVAAADE